jgi:hypothetical protein
MTDPEWKQFSIAVLFPPLGLRPAMPPISAGLNPLLLALDWTLTVPIKQLSVIIPLLYPAIPPTKAFALLSPPVLTPLISP